LKYGEEDFLPIKTNVLRINDIVNDAYGQLTVTKNNSGTIDTLPVRDFLKKIDVLVDALKLIFPVCFKNEIEDFEPSGDFKLSYVISNLIQIMENAVGNSVAANADTVYIRLLETDKHFVIELVDNGTGKNKNNNLTIKEYSAIPHGIGTQIIETHMRGVNGRAEWRKRFDQDGMILRLYFPMI
jgi:nitrogen fixation/metabolism regulation signal transduction histidine kinase